MRKTLLYIILLNMLMMAGCSEKQSAYGVLGEIEQIADQDPDRALRMMDSLQRDSALQGTDQRMLCELVTAEAMHAVGIPLKEDTVLQHCIDHFRQTGDERHEARAMLHHGMDLYYHGRYMEGLSMIKQVEKMTEDFDDPDLCFTLDAVMGDINDNAGNMPLTLHYYHRALEVAQKSEDVNRQVQMLNNLATTFDKTAQTDSLQYYVELSRALRDQTKAYIRATSLVNEGSLMRQKYRIKEALQLLESSRKDAPLDKGTMLLADINAQQGKMQEAHDLWYELLHSPNPEIRIHCYESLIAYYQQEGFHERVADLSKRLNQYYQRVYVESPSADIIALQTQMSQQEKERQQYRTTILLLSCISFLLVCILIGIGYYRRRISRLNTHIDSLNQKYLTWQMAESLLSSDIVNRLHRMAVKGKEAENEDWKALHALVQQQSPEFLARLNGATSLSPLETNVCLLIRLRFTPSEIATLTGISPQRVTNMRTSLLLKIFGEKGGARDFDSRLRGM